MYQENMNEWMIDKSQWCISYAMVYTIWILLIFVQHFIECVIKLGRHSVDLHLLSDNLVLQVINPEVELADVHLSVLRASLGLLQSDLNLLDLLLLGVRLRIISPRHHA